MILKYGPAIINSMPKNNERWNVIEQVYLAATELGDSEISNTTLGMLLQQFPTKDSDRVTRLVGLQFEALEEFTDAAKVYDAILANNPSNLWVRKRKVAIEKAKGNIHVAVEELLDILKFFPSDAGTWLELADLYLQVGDFKVRKIFYP